MIVKECGHTFCKSCVDIQIGFLGSCPEKNCLAKISTDSLIVNKALLGVINRPEREDPEEKPLTIKDFCERHPGNIILFFCKFCRVAGCQECMINDHDNSRPMDQLSREMMEA